MCIILKHFYDIYSNNTGFFNWLKAVSSKLKNYSLSPILSVDSQIHFLWKYSSQKFLKYFFWLNTQALHLRRKV